MTSLSLPRLPRPTRAHVLVSLAVVLLVAVGVVLAAPDRLADLSVLDESAQAVVSLAALLVGVLGLLFVLRLPSLTEATDPLDFEDSAAEIGRGDPLGHDVDEALDRYSEVNEWERIKARKLVQERLIHAIVHVLVEREGVTESAAYRQIWRGTWTDDRVAAAFLAKDDNVVLPLRVRLQEWLTGDQFARHARRVVAVLTERRAELRAEDVSVARESTRGGERTAAVRITVDGGER
ncbi:DUF7269 family protein [Halomarina oriensis]|uniref:Uncharacterized protein n=1 Tax=Halomarina oriensis TaxID=671145 RepID=A0A6B0GE76_9EURY|nr:hypothetical protein [Halomarina oriensis]MWG33004.1 hypothetical protein [Halomarina oriensis]